MNEYILGYLSKTGVFMTLSLSSCNSFNFSLKLTYPIYYAQLYTDYPPEVEEN